MSRRSRPGRPLLAAAAAVALAGAAWASEQNSAPPPQPAARVALHPEDLALLARIIEEIGNDFIEPRSGHQLLMSAMRQMVGALDKHSALIENASPAGLRDAMRGEFAGIGVEIEIRDDHPVVVSTLPDSPARVAGMRAGDRIESVDGRPMRGKSIEETIATIKGPAGSQVDVVYQRRGEAGSRSLALQRRLVRFRTAEVETHDDHVLVRVDEFLDLTVRELLDLLAKQPPDRLAKGVVLDLRGNPGGVVDAAVELASLFLPPQVLVMSVEGRPGAASQPRLSMPPYQLLAEPGSRRAQLFERLGEVPLLVLVDGQTASSAEIVAAALQSHGRAKVVGCEHSMGKGSIQSIIQLTNRYALKMTTARYRTPDGRDLEGTGVVPDIQPSAAAAGAGACAADPSIVWSLARRELGRQPPQQARTGDGRRRAGS